MKKFLRSRKFLLLDCLLLLTKLFLTQIRRGLLGTGEKDIKRETEREKSLHREKDIKRERKKPTERERKTERSIQTEKRGRSLARWRNIQIKTHRNWKRERETKE